MRKQDNPMIEDHPADTLIRVKAAVALIASVDWDSPMAGAEGGAQFLASEIVNALGYTIDQVAGVDKEHLATLE